MIILVQTFTILARTIYQDGHPKWSEPCMHWGNRFSRTLQHVEKGLRVSVEKRNKGKIDWRRLTIE